MRSPLAQAALDGNEQALTQLLARGAQMDGGDGQLYDDDTDGCIRGAPYYTPLGEAARMGHAACVQKLLAAGADVDVLNYRGESPLILAAFWDRIDNVKLLLDAKAKVDHVGCLGSALASLQPGYRDHALDIAQLLLAAGASPLATASYTDSALDKFLAAVPTGGKHEKKITAKLGELLRLFRDHVGDRASEIDEALAKIDGLVGKAAKKDAKDAGAITKLAAASGASWPADVRKACGSIGKPKDRATIEQVCKVVLPSPAAVAHAAWPQLVRDVIAMSRSYADATEAAYGERLPLSQLEEDEGGAMDYFADEHLYTWDWLLEGLARPAPRAHEDWSTLVRELCDAKQKAVGHYSFGDEEVVTLLAEATGHADHGALTAVAKKAFPFASWNGTAKPLPPPPTAAAASSPPAKAAPKKAAPKKAAPKKAAPKKAAPKKALLKAVMKAPPKKAPMKKAPLKMAPMKAPPKKAPMKAAPKKAPKKKKR